MYVAIEIKYAKINLCCIKHVIWLNIVFSKCNLLSLFPNCPLKSVKDASLSTELLYTSFSVLLMAVIMFWSTTNIM